jgi:hypothetical protein
MMKIMGIVRERRSRRRIERLLAVQSLELNHETGQRHNTVVLVFRESVELSLGFFSVAYKTC